MKRAEILKFLKDKSRISNTEIETFQISKENIEDICIEFNWAVSFKEIDGETYLIFLDENDQEITDFSKYNINDKYRTIFMLFQSLEDCKKFQDKFPNLKTDICNKTHSIEINSMEDCRVYNTKRVTTANRMQVTHSEQIMMYFNNWREMPEFYFNFPHDQYVKICVKYNKEYFTNDVLKNLLEQNITNKTDSVWFPKKDKNVFNYFRVLGGDENPKYPIYIVSKGRWDQFYYHTSRSISLIHVHHYICVEPQEVEAYEKSEINKSEYCHILPMDMSYKQKYNTLGNLGNSNATGSGAARNFCADHAKSNGFDMCWILDDNTEAFFRYWRGRRIIAYTPETFRSVERFVERYENIGLAGLNYHMFVINQDERPPFITNSKVYSYGLWNLKCPYIYQEGRYNEDVIQSLKILDTGYWTTVQWNLYLARKLRTQLLKGGNTTEIYDKKYGGTFTKSQMLVERFPQYAKLVWKFKRWHHEVNYTHFKQKLILKEEFKYLQDKDYNEINEHGAYIVKIDPKYHLDQKYDNKDFLEKKYPRGCPEDITRSNYYLLEDRNSMEIRNFWPDETPGKSKLMITITNSSVVDDKEILESPLFEDKIEKKLTLNEQSQKLNVLELNSNIKAGIRQNSEEFDINCL